MPDTGPEEAVTSCPACGHLLRVPRAMLGVRVQCPECRVLFQAPTRDPAGNLTAPSLVPAAAPTRKKPDPLLLLPAFGLLFCGVAGLVVNGILAYKFWSDPAGADGFVRGQVANLRQAGWFGADDPEAERDRRDADRAAEAVRLLRWVFPLAGGLSGVVFLGGLSIALRWNRRLAQVGCVAAALNLPHFCCLPGGVAGVWGLLMLASDEGRAHFAR